MNGTPESSSNTSLHAANPAELPIYIALEIFIAMFAFIGNALVLVAVWKFRALRTPTNAFVASLAAADFGVAILAIPSAILLRLGLSVSHRQCDEIIEGPSVGESTCLLIISSVIFLTQVSVFSLCLIAMDRFIAINHPFRYKTLMTTRLTNTTIVAAWILGALIGIVPQIGWNQWATSDADPCDRKRCAFEEVISMEFMVYFNFFGCILVPLLAMGVMYFFIFRSARKQLRKIYFDVKSMKLRSRSSELLTQPLNGFLGKRKNMKKRENSLPPIYDCSEPSSCLARNGGVWERNGAKHTEIATANSNKKYASVVSLGSLNTNNSHWGSTNTMDTRMSSDHLDRAEQRRRMKRKKQLLEKEFHAARSLATVVGLFAFCWLPLHILNNFTLFCKTCYQPMWLKDLAILLSHANSVVNPIIYAFNMRDFRNAFRKQLACCFTNSCLFERCNACGPLESINESSPEPSSDERSREQAHPLNVKVFDSPCMHNNNSKLYHSDHKNNGFRSDENGIESGADFSDEGCKIESSILSDFDDCGLLTPEFESPCSITSLTQFSDISIKQNFAAGENQQYPPVDARLLSSHESVL